MRRFVRLQQANPWRVRDVHVFRVGDGFHPDAALGSRSSTCWVTMVRMTDSSPTRVSLRSFWGDLPTEGRWLLSTVAVQTLGRGLTLPFTIIYINEIRGVPLDVAGTLMSLIFVAALCATAPGGALTDRLGARVMVIAATTSQIIGLVVMAFAETPLVIGLACVFLGISQGVSWPAFNALVASVVRGQTRMQYFGVNFALVNLGIGLGGIIGGLYVDVARPETFTMIFLANAVTMLVPIALLFGPLRHLHARAERPVDAETDQSSYLQIIRRPAVLWITVLTFIGGFVGYAQMEAGVPAFARSVGEVSTRTVGIAFGVNTVVIVALQFLVLRFITGHRRTRVLMAMTATWALSWVALGGSGILAGTHAAELFVILWAVIFALGETMLQPTIPAITNDLAPDHARGRYNALSAGAFQSAAIVGPIVAGVLLEHSLGSLYLGILVAGCGLAAALALALERTISPEVNGVTDGSRAGVATVTEEVRDTLPENPITGRPEPTAAERDSVARADTPSG
jgi:MFS family permease